MNKLYRSRNTAELNIFRKRHQRSGLFNCSKSKDGLLQHIYMEHGAAGSRQLRGYWIIGSGSGYTM